MTNAETVNLTATIDDPPAYIFILLVANSYFSLTNGARALTFFLRRFDANEARFKYGICFYKVTGILAIIKLSTQLFSGQIVNYA